MSKSSYKVITESLIRKDLDFPTDRVAHRKLSVDEIKTMIKEEFGKAKKACKVKVAERPKGWGDDALEKEIEWIKKLGIKEFFKPSKKKR